MRRYILTFAIATALLFLGCGNRSADMLSTENVALSDIPGDAAFAKVDASQSPVPANTEELNKADLENVDPKTTVQDKKIIRTGNISLEAKDIKNTKRSIDAMVKKYQAYYEQDNISAGNSYTNYSLTVRIPAANFEGFLKELENGSDKITEKSMQANDVSMQYYDLSSRLKSKRIYLDRYQKMAGSAKSVKELLEIEEQIRKLQEDIDSNESMLRNLSGQVSYSTLSINIYYSVSGNISSPNSFGSKLKEAIGSGAALIVDMVIGLLSIWPIVVLLITGAVLFLRWKRKRLKN